MPFTCSKSTGNRLNLTHQRIMAMRCLRNKKSTLRLLNVLGFVLGTTVCEGELGWPRPALFLPLTRNSYSLPFWRSLTEISEDQHKCSLQSISPQQPDRHSSWIWIWISYWIHKLHTNHNTNKHLRSKKTLAIPQQVMGRGGSVVSSVPSIQRVAGSHPTLPPCRDLGQVLRSQLPLALWCETPAQYSCCVGNASE